MENNCPGRFMKFSSSLFLLFSSSFFFHAQNAGMPKSLCRAAGKGRSESASV